MLAVMLSPLRGYLAWKWLEGAKIANRKVIENDGEINLN